MAIVAIVVACAAVKNAAQSAAKNHPVSPEAVLLDAQKACTLYGLGVGPRSKVLDETCDSLLGLCGDRRARDSGAGGAP